MGKTAEDQRNDGDLYLPPTQPSSTGGNQSRLKTNEALPSASADFPRADDDHP